MPKHPFQCTCCSAHVPVPAVPICLLHAHNRSARPAARCAAENAKIPCVGGHPKNIIMLCCDAFGVLPPVAKLTKEQAMYYFIRWGGRHATKRILSPI